MKNHKLLSATCVDRTASVQAINYGVNRGTVINETVEVPWPVRAIAAAR